MADERPEIIAYQQCTANLISAIENFPEDKFNDIPSGGGWSAAMVADHLLQVEKRIAHILAIPAGPAERSTDEKLATIKKSLLNREVKLTAPSFLTPKSDIIDKSTVLAALHLQNGSMLQHLQASSPNEFCTEFPHHRLGEMTKLEWTWFTIYHTKRHIVQLNEIQASLAG